MVPNDTCIQSAIIRHQHRQPKARILSRTDANVCHTPIPFDDCGPKGVSLPPDTIMNCIASALAEPTQSRVDLVESGGNMQLSVELKLLTDVNWNPTYTFVLQLKDVDAMEKVKAQVRDLQHQAKTLASSNREGLSLRFTNKGIACPSALLQWKECKENQEGGTLMLVDKQAIAAKQSGVYMVSLDLSMRHEPGYEVTGASLLEANGKYVFRGKVNQNCPIFHQKDGNGRLLCGSIPSKTSKLWYLMRQEVGSTAETSLYQAKLETTVQMPPPNGWKDCASRASCDVLSVDKVQSRDLKHVTLRWKRNEEIVKTHVLYDGYHGDHFHSVTKSMMLHMEAFQDKLHVETCGAKQWFVVDSSLVMYQL